MSIDDNVLRQAKQAAEESGRTLSEFVEQAIRSALLPRRTARRTLKPLPTFKGSGPQPQVDFSDNAAVRALELEWEIRDRPEKYPWLRDPD